MPSPFPGMDPYLEAPDIWPDLHDALAAEIRGELNQTLPSPYYARLELRPEVGIVEEGVAVLEQARADVSRSFDVTVHMEPIRHHFVEVRDPTRGHKLITLIEILSPTNKRRGPDRDAYERNQREVLESDASLIEVDLLRTGGRPLASPELAAFVAHFEPAPDYLVLVGRSWRRTDAGLGYSVFPFGLREWLPCIPVPLRDGEPEVPLDLQFVLNRAYDTGPYRRGAVDYTRPPDPPLSGADAAWAEALLRDRGQ